TSTLCLCCSPPLRHLHSFPTRRSSDLAVVLHLRPEAIRPVANTDYTHIAAARTAQPDPSQIQVFLHVTGSAYVHNESRYCVHPRSEEHTSELQSRENLVCRLLLEKKKA